MAEIFSFTYEDLATLHSIAKILAKAMELREQLEQVLNELSTKAGMKRGMISILDRETGDAVLDVAHEVDIAGIQISYKPGEGITGQVAQTCRPMAVPSMGKDSVFLDRTGARRELNRTELAFLCVPIIYEGQAVGVLSADKVTSHVYTLEYELQLLSEVAALMAKAVHMRRIEEENVRLKDMLNRSKHPYPELKGNSRIMKEVFSLITQVADSSTSVLIHGETGTGKELVARAIHHGSPRKDGPFIEVNCAAMPDTLIESELFGHEKGAFTGAHQRRRGKFEEAHGGSIFLDEIGELSPMAQAKLLRVLQEKQFQPLGSSRTIKVNVRVVAATNRNLEEDVTSGAFRTDLYYRLNVFPIFIPPLRERGSDILLLADHFIEKYAGEFTKAVKRLSTPAIDCLLAYHWPGNVRELENCIERAVLVTPGDTIESMHLPPSLQMKQPGTERKKSGTLQGLVESYERALITDTLKDVRGNMSKASQTLGSTKRIIQYKVLKYGIDPQRFKAKK
jgi:Nif-specific regulatory protein